MNENKLYAFYGSLRPGMYNADAFQKHYGDFTIVEENKVLTGYKMYSLGAYPFCVKTGDNTDTVIVTLVKLNNDKQAAVIDAMEKGASYYYDEVTADVKLPTTSEEESKSPSPERFGIYLFPNRAGVTAAPVEDGDWVKYYTSKKS